jgi:proline iminopeptidase
LGIEQWSILGHSFGARPALRYAVRHPTAVSSVVFECPPWDHGYGLPAMLELAIPLLEAVGQTEAADRARAMIAAGPTPNADVWRQRFEIVNALGDRRNDLYIKDARRFSDPFPSESLPEETQAASARHSETVRASDGFSESLLPLLSEVRQPALLIRGQHRPGGELARSRTIPRRRTARTSRDLRGLGPLSANGGARTVRRLGPEFRRDLTASR